VPRRINQGRGLSRVRCGLSDAQLFGQSRTPRIKQLLGLTDSTGWFDLAVPAGTIVHTPIFIVFRGPQAYLNSCGVRKTSGCSDCFAKSPTSPHPTDQTGFCLRKTPLVRVCERRATSAIPLTWDSLVESLHVNFNARALAPHHIASPVRSESLALAEPVDDGHLELEGCPPIHVIETGRTDTVDDLATRPGPRLDRLR